MESGDIILIVFVLGLLAAGFMIQFSLCRKSDKVLTKLWPAIILVGIEIICIVVILVTGADSEPAQEISLIALSQMAICAVILVPVELAWLTYGIMWFVEKKKNNQKVLGENT